jgi:hypothetical protein
LSYRSLARYPVHSSSRLAFKAPGRRGPVCCVSDTGSSPWPSRCFTLREVQRKVPWNPFLAATSFHCWIKPRPFPAIQPTSVADDK